MTKKFRVAEIFGPTIQGEGELAGIPCHFVRFGGCDLRCSWCDTPHAVLPDQVAQLPQMTVVEIVEEIGRLGPVKWIVITGGNPALLDLGGFIDACEQWGWRTMLETQGTVYHPWLVDIDSLCISPKPPSSGNTVMHPRLAGFINQYLDDGGYSMYLKVVVFDDADFDYARDVHGAWPSIPMFLSVGNESPDLPTVAHPERRPSRFPDRTVSTVLEKYRWLIEKTLNYPTMHDVRVMPQLHTLVWGNQRGH